MSIEFLGCQSIPLSDEEQAIANMHGFLRSWVCDLSVGLPKGSLIMEFGKASAIPDDPHAGSFTKFTDGEPFYIMQLRGADNFNDKSILSAVFLHFGMKAGAGRVDPQKPSYTRVFRGDLKEVPIDIILEITAP